MVAVLAPRWEWRTFSEHFGERAESAFAHRSPYQVSESKELYLLSAADAAVAKVRDGLMDVKQLQQLRDDGLEQWLPVRKTAFPLSSAEVGAVLTDLGVAVPPSLTRTEYSLDALLEDVVEPESADALHVYAAASNQPSRFPGLLDHARWCVVDGGKGQSGQAPAEDEDGNGLPAHADASGN